MPENSSSDSTKTNGGGTPSDRPDGLFSGDVVKGLERLRRRLLDLTKRNRLLNFRHSRRSSVRAVDEMPDQLYENLLRWRPAHF